MAFWVRILAFSILILIFALETDLFLSLTSVLLPRILRAVYSAFSPVSVPSLAPLKMIASTSAFMDAVKARRSIYALNNISPISDTSIEQLVRDTMLHVPSAFNSQSTRAVLLLNQEHQKFWEMAKEVLGASAADEEAAKKTNGRIDGFKGAYGTVSCFRTPRCKAVRPDNDTYSSVFRLTAPLDHVLRRHAHHRSHAS